MSVFAPQLLTSPSWYAELEPPLPTDDAWIMEPKFDGWRFVFHVTPDGKVINYGRNGGLMDYRIPAYLVEELVRRLPPDSIIDCEVCVDGPGMQSTDVSTVLANHAKGRLTAYVFDIMRCAGTDTRSLPWIQRRYVLDLALDGKPGMFLQRSPYCEPNLDVFKQWLAIGMEGAVLKRKESPYRSGTRNNDWLKVKPQRTADCRIVALPTDGQGKYTGMVGAVEFEVAPGKIGRASART
jgi:bifunctional non-homologous end joining protein LigD